jgi:hypothetical protein
MKIPLIDKLFEVFGSEKNRKRIERVKERAYEAISIPTILIFGLLVRVVTSFVGWIRAILISWVFWMELYPITYTRKKNSSHISF